MLIKEVTLKNYGKHKDLKLTKLDVPIIGIVGANGNGKTTILKAISYAFKGKEDESSIQESISLGETNGFIDVSFEKDGINGRITRKFGKVDSAVLIWGEEKLTKKSEINKRIDDILGIDKQVLSNTIFIKQGEVLGLIEETPAKRIDLFSKLLNLDYFNKRCALANDAYKGLQSSVTDIQNLKDLLSKDENDLKNLTDEYNSKLEEFNQKYISIDYIKDLKQKLDKYSYLRASISSLETELSQSSLSLAEIKESTAKFNNDKLECVSAKEKLISERSNISGRMYEFFNKADFVKNYEYLYKTLIEVYKIDSQIDDLFYNEEINHQKELKENEDKINAFKLDIKNQIQSVEYLNYLSRNVKRIQEDLKASEYKYNNIVDKEKKASSYYKTISDTFKSNKALLDLRESAKALVNKKHDAKCPVCGGELNSSSIDEALLKQLKASTDLLEIESKKAYDKYDDLHMQMLNTLNIKELREREWKQFCKEFVQDFYRNFCHSSSPLSFKEFYNLNYYIVPKQKEVLKKEIFYKYLSLEYRINSVITGIKETNGNLKDPIDYDSSAKNALDRQHSLLRDIDDKILTLDNKIRSIDKCLFKNMQDESKLSAMYAQIKCNQEQIEELGLRGCLDKLSEINPAFNLQVDQIEQYIKSIVDLEIDRINDLNAKIKVYTQSVDSRKKDIKGYLDKNENVFNIMSEVNNVAWGLNIKNTDSIPRSYMNYLFRHICENVKENLALMDTDFIVEVNENEDLSFKFKKIDEIDKPWLDMKRLSSGQKVRLGVATLIAIQKIICPELGFLVLDEPSTHLDDNSVEALATMLIELQKILKASKSQIWFVDHNKNLERCCNKIIQL